MTATTEAATGEATTGKLGILAGGGQLPARIAERCEATGRPYFIAAFNGYTDPSVVEGRPHMWARLGAAGSVIDRLHAEKVEQICMIGPVRRPSLLDLAPDAKAAAFFAKIGFRALGDNALLTAIADVLAQEGFALIGAKSLLSDMLLTAGPAGNVEPDERGRADITLGASVVDSLGRLDIGQAAIVQQGMVISVEAIEGTDALLARSAGLLRNGPGAILVKAAKPQQDRRLDLPTIGLATVEKAAEIGLAGIAAGSGSTLIVDRSNVIAACDKAGLFLFGFNADQTQ